MRHWVKTLGMKAVMGLEKGNGMAERGQSGEPDWTLSLGSGI